MQFFLILLIMPLVQSSKLKINIINKFIDDIPHSRKVTAFLCWTTSQEISLVNLIQKKSYYSTIIKSNTNFSYLEESSLFVADDSCNIKDILKKAEECNLFRIKSTWLIFSSIEELIQFDIYFPIDSKLYVAEIKNNTFKIKTLYRILEHNATNVVQNIPDDKGIFSEIKLFPQRSNLFQTTINVSFVMFDEDTLNHLTDYRHLHIDNLFKINYLIMNHAFHLLNARINMILRNTWGYKNATTGKYSEGMILDIQEGFCLMGGTSTAFLPDRMNIIDYVAPTSPANFRFIFKDPPLSYTKNIFTLPFDTYVWYSSLALVLLTYLAIYLTTGCKYIVHENSEEMPSITDIALLEVAAVTQQDTHISPSSYSGRIILIFTFFVLMFLYTAYSACIVALLQSSSDSITTVADLVNTYIKIGVEDAVYSDPFMRAETEPIKRELYFKKIAPPGRKPNFMPISEGLMKVKDNFFAFHGEITLLYTLINMLYKDEDKCGLKEIKYVNMFNTYIPFKKNSPLKEILKIGHLREKGVQAREIKKIIPEKPKCVTSKSFGSVGLIDCYFIFVLFLCGVILSLVVLLLEMLYYRYKTKINIIEI